MFTCGATLSTWYICHRKFCYQFSWWHEWMNDEICARVGVWSHWEIKPVILKTAIWSSHNFFTLSNFTFNCIWFSAKCNRKQSTLTSIVKSVKLFLACCIRYVLQFLKCMWGSTTVLPKGRIIVHLYTHILKFYFCLLPFFDILFSYKMPELKKRQQSKHHNFKGF